MSYMPLRFTAKTSFTIPEGLVKGGVRSRSSGDECALVPIQMLIDDPNTAFSQESDGFRRAPSGLDSWVWVSKPSTDLHGGFVAKENVPKLFEWLATQGIIPLSALGPPSTPKTRFERLAEEILAEDPK